MPASIAMALRRTQILLAGGGLLALAACASEPAQIGTPEYAWQRLFSTRPYRSTEQMLEAYRPQPAEPATAATGTAEAPAGEESASGGESETRAEAVPGTPTPLTDETPSVPAGVTVIELNDWYLFPRGGYRYQYPFPPYQYSYPYYHYPRPYRPFYRRLYGPGGCQRCFGACGGLSLSIGGSKSRFSFNAGSFESSSRSTVLVSPPYRYPGPLGGPRATLLPPVRTLR